MTVEQLVTLLLTAVFDGRLDKDSPVETADGLDIKVVVFPAPNSGSYSTAIITDAEDDDS